MKKGGKHSPKFVRLNEMHELCLCTEPMILRMFRTAIFRGSAAHFTRAARLLAKIATMRRDIGRKIMEKVDNVTGSKGDKYLPVVTARSVVLYLKHSLHEVEMEVNDSATTGRIKVVSLRAGDPDHAFASLLDVLDDLFNCSEIKTVGSSPYSYVHPSTCPTCRGKISIRVVYPLDERRALVRCLKCGSYYVAGRYTLIKYSERGSKVENLNLVTGRAT